MKLHLPKSLFAILVGAMLTYSVAADNVEVGKYDAGSKVMTDSFTQYLPSSSSQMQEVKGNLTLSGTDKLGLLSNGAFVTLGVTKYSGYSFLGAGYFKREQFQNVTKNFKVTGTLTLNESAQVQLGGQVKVDALGSSYDEYTGVIANEIVVNDTASLTSYNATVDVLEVNGGSVSLHTNGNSKYGNTYFVVDEAYDSKQVSIRSELNINGGTTTIGNASGSYLQTSFGKLTYEGDTWVGGTLYSVDKAEIESSLISQTAGTLNVQGDSVSVGGLNISQTGGANKAVMSISNGAYHDLADYGDSTIAQHNLHADTVLNLGIIRAYNSQYDAIKGQLEENGVKVELSPSLDISHSGAGDINMSGVDFTAEIGYSSSISSITQSDYVDENTGAITATTGSINLNGQYLGATFDIAQAAANGSINLNGSMAVNEVKQTAGTINVAKGASMSADSVSVGGVFEVKDGGTLTAGAITVTEGGKLVNNGVISGASAAMLAADDDSMLIVIAGGSMENYGQTDKAILVQDGGVLTLGDGASVGAVTMEQGGDISISGTATTGALTLTGGTITFTEGAMLEVTDGMNVTISDAVTIEVKLSDAALEDIVNGGSYDLFKVVEGDTSSVTTVLNGATISFVSTSNAENRVEAVVQQDGGSVKIETLVPEPTTATLSLLALAALAARRRRK